MSLSKHAALVVMAAGMGSRYGGVKQLDSFGPDGEIIMDYSIYDAIKAGFDKVVIIIRKDIKADFMDVIGNRLKEKAGVPVFYAFQDPYDIPDGFSYPEGRKKPWGTGQAVLAAREFINEPFLVINSDDFYGREPYDLLYRFLTENDNQDNGIAHFCMAGYRLGNTLSDNGTVTRGICTVDSNDYLNSITETFSIKEANGNVSGADGAGNNVTLSADDTASMNMMGFTPAIFKELSEKFIDFMKALPGKDPLKSEFLLPEIVSAMIKEGRADMKVLSTDEHWYGVTYREDREAVRKAFRKLTESGVYSKELWN